MNRLRNREYHPPRLSSSMARRLDPDRAARLTMLAEARMEALAHEHAAEVLKGALVFDPLADGIRHSLAQALYKSGDFTSALSWLGQAHREPSARDELLRGKIMSDQNRWPDALEAFGRALALEPELLEARLRRATVRLSSGDPAGALPDLDSALHKGGDNSWARTLRASARMESGQAQAALEDLETIPSAEHSAYHILLMARASILSGRSDSEVDQTFERGIAVHRADPRLPIAYARHLIARRASDPQALGRARKQLETLLHDSQAEVDVPRQLKAEALFLLAEVTAEDPQDGQRAETLFQAGLNLAPDDPQGLCGLGWMLLEQGRAAHALPWLIRAALVEPDRPRTVELLATALPVISDDDAVARWLGLLLSGLPQEAPRLLSRLLRYVQEGGRNDAYEDVRRQAHRMKNRIAVMASRARLDGRDEPMGQRLDSFYDEWGRFLQTIRLRPPSPRLLAPASLLRQALEQVAPKPDRVVSTMPTGLPLVRGDGAQLVDALANILANALQASPDDKPVRTRIRTSGDLRWVEIAVSDEGPGISSQDKHRIFDLGYTSKKDGSGVGLSVARRAIMSHGGRLMVTSALGGPTTFTTRLPAAAQQAPASLRPFETLALEQLADRESTTSDRTGR